MARLEPIHPSLDEWGRILDGFPDRLIFQTPGWLAFLAESQNGRIVFAALKEGNETLGYFCGVIVRRFGVRILGSPFRGWSTPYMGFNLHPGVSRRVAVSALPEFALRQLGCIHFELVDSHLMPEDIQGLNFTHQLNATIEVDLTRTEDDIFNHFSSSCRRNVRYAQKHGVVVEEAQDDAFADEYATQLVDVFAKQGLVPHFGAVRVRQLIKHLRPAGQLLMLRARDAERNCIATGLYPSFHDRTYYWGGASWRQYQKLYPNELLHWHAMQYWKKRGARSYNFVGTMEFKQKFGGIQTVVPLISQSKYRAISFLRSTAPKILNRASRLVWKLKSLGKDKPEPAATDAGEVTKPE